MKVTSEICPRPRDIQIGCLLLLIGTIVSTIEIPYIINFFNRPSLEAWSSLVGVAVFYWAISLFIIRRIQLGGLFSRQLVIFAFFFYYIREIDTAGTSFEWIDFTDHFVSSRLILWLSANIFLFRKTSRYWFYKKEKKRIFNVMNGGRPHPFDQFSTTIYRIGFGRTGIRKIPLREFEDAGNSESDKRKIKIRMDLIRLNVFFYPLFLINTAAPSFAVIGILLLVYLIFYGIISRPAII